MTAYSANVYPIHLVDGDKDYGVMYQAGVNGKNVQTCHSSDEAWEVVRLRVGEMNAAKESNLGSAGC